MLLYFLYMIFCCTKYSCFRIQYYYTKYLLCFSVHFYYTKYVLCFRIQDYYTKYLFCSRIQYYFLEVCVWTSIHLMHTVMKISTELFKMHISRAFSIPWKEAWNLRSQKLEAISGKSWVFWEFYLLIGHPSLLWVKSMVWGLTSWRKSQLSLGVLRILFAY